MKPHTPHSWSPLLAGLPQRLGVVVALLAVLWLIVVWSLSS